MRNLSIFGSARARSGASCRARSCSQQVRSAAIAAIWTHTRWMENYRDGRRPRLASIEFHLQILRSQRREQPSVGKAANRRSAQPTRSWPAMPTRLVVPAGFAVCRWSGLGFAEALRVRGGGARPLKGCRPGRPHPIRLGRFEAFTIIETHDRVFDATPRRSRCSGTVRPTELADLLDHLAK